MLQCKFFDTQFFKNESQPRQMAYKARAMVEYQNSESCCQGIWSPFIQLVCELWLLFSDGRNHELSDTKTKTFQLPQVPAARKWLPKILAFWISSCPWIVFYLVMAGTTTISQEDNIRTTAGKWLHYVHATPDWPTWKNLTQPIAINSNGGMNWWWNGIVLLFCMLCCTFPVDC